MIICEMSIGFVSIFVLQYSVNGCLKWIIDKVQNIGRYVTYWPLYIVI